MKSSGAILLVDFIGNSGRINAPDFDKIRKRRTVSEKYFGEKFLQYSIFTCYTGKRNIRKNKMEHADGFYWNSDKRLFENFQGVQEALEMIRTEGYLFVYVQPLFGLECPGRRELEDEIDTRISYGCFSDIIMSGYPCGGCRHGELMCTEDMCMENMCGENTCGEGTDLDDITVEAADLLSEVIKA